MSINHIKHRKVTKPRFALTVCLLIVGLYNSACLAQTPANSISEKNDKITLKVGFDRQPPYRFMNDQGIAIGIDIERVKLFLDQAQIAYEFYEYPWPRVLRNIESGVIDLTVAAAKLPDRQAYAYFSSTPFKHGTNSLIVTQANRAKFNNITSLSDVSLLDVKIATRNGASYSDEYDRLLGNNEFTKRLVFTNSVKQSIAIAKAGRVDGVLAGPLIFAYEQAKICQPGVFIEILNLLEHEDTANYVMMSKASVSLEIFERVNNAMQQVGLTKLEVQNGLNSVLPTCHLQQQFIPL